MADHPAGLVVFCDTITAQRDVLKPAIAEVQKHRGVKCCKDEAATRSLLESLPDGEVVCIVAARGPGIELAKYLRDPQRGPFLRSVPLIVFTREARARVPAASVGSIVVTEKEKLAARVLSLPSKHVVMSETSACRFKGLTSDLQFGHFKDSPDFQDWKFSLNTKLIQQGLHSTRTPWYPRCANYDDHIGKLGNYVRALQPVHRCKPGVFLAMLQSGGLMSKTELEVFLAQSKDVKTWARAYIHRHAKLQELCRDLYAYRRALHEYAELMCTVHILRNATDFRAGTRVHHGRRTGVVKNGPDADDDCVLTWDDDGSESDFIHISKLTKIPDEQAGKDVEQSAKELRKSLPQAYHNQIDDTVQKVVLDMYVSSQQKFVGIGYKKDLELGTHRHVFSTYGVNGCFGYGSVVLMLKPGILYHPDTWISPIAATGFMKPYWAFMIRPWSGANLAIVAEDLDWKGQYASVADQPECDAQGVEACIRSSYSLAATDGWDSLIAREVDAMCHCLCFGHRRTFSMDDGTGLNHGEGWDWRDKDLRSNASMCLLDMKKSKVLERAWRTVVDFYETKDSHSLFECHLPGFVPLGAIESIIIRKGLYDSHSDIKAKVDSFILPDGRRLRDLVQITDSQEECMKWQHDKFERRREELAKDEVSDPRRTHPVSVQAHNEMAFKGCSSERHCTRWQACRGVPFSYLVTSHHGSRTSQQTRAASVSRCAHAACTTFGCLSRRRQSCSERRLNSPIVVGRRRRTASSLDTTATRKASSPRAFKEVDSTKYTKTMTHWCDA